MRIFCVVTLAAALAGCAGDRKIDETGTRSRIEGERFARVDLKTSDGQNAGWLRMKKEDKDVEITGKLQNLPPGDHGMHIHEVGKCEAPDFKSAGDHYNPTGKQHGQDNPMGYHAGDLGNINVGSDGTSAVDMKAKNLELWAGDSAMGKSVVVHAQRDDMKTDPSGNSGERIACGLIVNGAGTD
jgi:superoxide dismutase, Cu-Zn family